MVAVPWNLSSDCSVVLQSAQRRYGILSPLNDRSHRSNTGFWHLELYSIKGKTVKWKDATLASFFSSFPSNFSTGCRNLSYNIRLHSHVNWFLQPVFADITPLRATGFVHWKWRHTENVENTRSALYFLINSHFPASMMEGKLRFDEWNWDSQWNRALKSCQISAKVNKKETDISEQTAFPLFKTRSPSCTLPSQVRIHPSWDRRQPAQQRQLIDVKDVKGKPPEDKYVFREQC